MLSPTKTVLLFVALQFTVIYTAVQSAVIADEPGGRYRCPDLGPLHRGSRQPFYGGATMVYRCDHGYTMSGSNLVRCLPTGEWNLPKPTCIGSGCTYPGKIENGSEKQTFGGNIITYKCYNGYVMRGSSTIYCDGEHWSDAVPECIGTTITSFAKVSFCRDPGRVENSEREDYENDGVVIYRCALGFETVGSPVIRCLYNGKWNVPSPVCAKTGCVTPPVVTNAYSQKMHRDTVIKYTCYEGHLLRGSSAIFCDGQRWNDTAPVCVPVGTVVNPYGEEGGRGKVTQAGGFVQLESEINTGVENDSVFRVEGGQTCNSAPRLPFSGFKYSLKRDSYGNNYYVVIYDCIALYRLVGGDAELYCSQGQWKGTPPVCEPEDPCSINNGGCQHQCELDALGGVQCRCRRGYQLLDERNCADINECLDNGGHGPCSHTCQNRIGGFECYCPSGYKLMDDALTCEVVLDPCLDNNGGCSHQCININRQAYCSCPGGYRRGYDGKTCDDINECSEGRGHCYDGACENTPGSFRCVCNTGFYMATNGRCTDIDECSVDNGRCSHECRNSWGSYSCRCPSGYQLSEDQHTCVDQNECLNPYYHYQCAYGCENTPGSFHCVCPTGFTTARNRITCVDINECEENSGLGPCEQHCTNTGGSFRCSCIQPGYQLSRDGITCEDIDECLDESTCGHICVNFPGGHRCSCNPGYILLPDERTCEGCRPNSYKSTTADECIECPVNSYTEGPGKSSISDCVCSYGFEGDPSQDIPCQDVNECEYDNNGCSDHCINTPGSAYCVCPVGFQLEWSEEKACIDIDECSQNGGGCEQNCLNTVGSFECSCKDGYIIDPDDPYMCADIDECVHNNGGCSQRCVNYPGGYLCECDEVSIINEDGKSCEPVVCSALAVPPHGKVKPRGACSGDNLNKPLLVGTVCTFDCLKGYVLSGSEKRICENTGHWSGFEVTCTPVVCPNLPSPENGKVLPVSCERGRGLNRYQTQCVFTCNDGYELVGNKVTKCQHDRTWSKEPATCVKQDKEPRISCASDLTIELPPGTSSIITSIPSPIANTENIQVNRPTTDTMFTAGKTTIHYAAIGEDGEKKATCVVNVNVIDKEPPTVTNCPESFRVETGTRYPTNIDWEVPVFADNVGIVEEWNSRDPGGAFTWGVYNVVYVAKDAANNAAECSFTIEIEPKTCGKPDGPLNGDPDCVDWLFGKICNPVCNDGYVFYDGTPPQLYMCGANATWTPSKAMPDCTEYIDVEDESSQCPNGYELKSYDQAPGTVCVKCPHGMFFSVETKNCTDCPVGTYQDEFGQTRCRQCPRGRSTATTGSKSQTDCTVSADETTSREVEESGEEEEGQGYGATSFHGNADDDESGDSPGEHSSIIDR